MLFYINGNMVNFEKSDKMADFGSVFIGNGNCY